ncbi:MULTISPECIES: hypothetical protein [unclassified Tolypothrix]|nr:MULTISPECIES: hypothetical protein [unclassified Tolypothrix]EKE97167.1 hypothetical protein FDUTEX481_05378 [Tolypothrix sp. PCC 7601]UYD34860.1 hypothetical protein HG267_03315 [Tolypothrix sp. PCC 7601]
MGIRENNKRQTPNTQPHYQLPNAPCPMPNAPCPITLTFEKPMTQYALSR